MTEEPTTDRSVNDGPAHEAGASGDATTVLAVEDDDFMRKVTGRILSRNGFETTICASGDEALAHLRDRDRDLDLLLTDVIMPGMLGRELAEAVRKIQPTVHVLYMSGYDHQTLTTQGILDPGVVLISKPFSEPALVAKMREVLDRPA